MLEDLLRTFVGESWIEQLDFSTLHRINAKLHAEGLERREGDMIYRVNLNSGEEVYIYLLLEFQSQPSRWMSVRLMVYVGLLYQHLIREKQFTADKQLPPVFPLVLYNGDQPWPYSTTLSDNIALPSGSVLKTWQPQFQFYLLEENRYKNKKIKTITGYLFQFENCIDYNDINRIIGELDQYLSDPAQRSLRRAFSRWISQVLAPSKGLTLGAVQTEELSEVKDMLATRVKQWEQEILQKGLQKGIEQGVVKGEAKMLIKQLVKRFGSLSDEVMNKITLASEHELEQWGLNLLDAKTLDDVFVDDH